MRCRAPLASLPFRLQPREPREPKTSAAPAEPRAARAKAPKAAKPPKVVDANAPLSKTMLFVGGLPETIGTDELKAKFEKFGELSDAFGALRHLRSIHFCLYRYSAASRPPPLVLIHEKARKGRRRSYRC